MDPHCNFKFNTPLTSTISINCALMSNTSSKPEGEMPAPLNYEIITVPKSGDIDHDLLFKQCYDIRIEVFSKEQGFPADIELDE